VDLHRSLAGGEDSVVVAGEQVELAVYGERRDAPSLIQTLTVEMSAATQRVIVELDRRPEWVVADPAALLLDRDRSNNRRKVEESARRESIPSGRVVDGEANCPGLTT
jgi:hypothetical protein